MNTPAAQALPVDVLDDILRQIADAVRDDPGSAIEILTDLADAIVARESHDAQQEIGDTVLSARVDAATAKARTLVPFVPRVEVWDSGRVHAA